MWNVTSCCWLYHVNPLASNDLAYIVLLKIPNLKIVSYIQPHWNSGLLQQLKKKTSRDSLGIGHVYLRDFPCYLPIQNWPNEASRVQVTPLRQLMVAEVYWRCTRIICTTFHLPRISLCTAAIIDIKLPLCLMDDLGVVRTNSNLCLTDFFCVCRKRRR
jgi:hypothetical protein